MTFKNSRPCIFSLLYLCVFWTLSAKDLRYQGGVVLLEASPPIEIKDSYTGDSVSPESFPDYLPGLFSLNADIGAHVHFNTSNDLSLSFFGPGYFAIERFEERILKSSDSELESSQMIMTLRAGTFLVDCRRLAANSVLMVETPVGRMTTGDALWSIEINFNERNQNYDLVIECLSGSLRFVSSSNKLYQLSGSRRLFGVGKKAAFSIEITELSEAGLEALSLFIENNTTLSENYESETLMKQRKLIRVTDLLPIDTSTTKSDAPVIIEFAPQIDSLIPFRGVSK